jgi:hypothetical protein
VKKVLVISYFFPPMGMAGAVRSVKFIKYFPRYDWHPVVVTAAPRSYYAKDEYLLEEIDLPEVEIHRTKGKKHSLLTDRKLRNLPNESRRQLWSKLMRATKVPDPYIKWKNKALKLASRIIESQKISVMYAAAPPFTDFVIAAELKRKYGIPLVVDYRDSWLYSPENFYPTNMYRFANMKKEQEVLRVADVTLVVNRRIKEHIIETYPSIKHTDVNIMPFSFDDEEFKNATYQLPRTNKMRFTHTGSFYGETPKYFLKGLAAAFKRRPELRKKIEACFIGLLSKEDKKRVLKYGLIESVYAPGYVNHKECVKYLLASDVLWFTIGKQQNDELISPLKLSEYFGARKPILACIPDGVSKQMLRNYNAVKICPPDEPEAVADMILEYYDLYSKNAMPEPNEEVVKKYDTNTLTHELVRYFEFLIDISPETKLIKHRMSGEDSEDHLLKDE